MPYLLISFNGTMALKSDLDSAMALDAKISDPYNNQSKFLFSAMALSRSDLSAAGHYSTNALTDLERNRVPSAKQKKFDLLL